MAQKPSQDAQTIRPLWVIANLLLLIAVCLLLVVIKNQLSDSHKDTSTLEAASDDQPVRNTDRGARNTLRITSRQTVSSRHAAEAAQSLAVGDAVESAPESPPVPPDRILPPTQGGVIAAVIASATNFTTAIAGRVTLRGEPPPEKPIDMSGSPCSKLQTNSPTTRFFAVGPDGGLADVIVSIAGGLDQKRYEAAQTNHELVFVNCQIQPYVSGVMTGQKIAFRNTDRTLHVPHLTPTNNAEASFMLDHKSATHLLRMDRPENLIRIKCDVHPWEFAYVSVLEHPFFAVTDTNGNFVIPNIPAGKYTLRALHRKAQSTNEIAQEVRVNRGEISQVSLTLDAPAR